MTENNSDTAGQDNDGIIRELREVFASRYGEVRTELIEAGRVRDYLLAMNEPLDGEEGDPVPPLFLLTLGRTRRPQPSRGSAVKAGDEFEFRRPVHVGDRITIRHELGDIEEKQGRQGTMFLLSSSTTYTNQNDEVVAVSRQSTLRWGL